MSYVEYAGVTSQRVREVCARCLDLKATNDTGMRDRARIRDIMNGGSKAIAALVPGSTQKDAPFANLMLSAGERLAEKLGRPPTARKEPPANADTEAARKKTEKIMRIVDDYDEASKLAMMLPQVGRWMPGYGFAPVVIRHGWVKNGQLQKAFVEGAQPFPVAELRDPFEAYPGEWGIGQQPDDIAFMRVVSKRTLCAMYPEHADKIDPQRRSHGGVMLDGGFGGGERAGWANQSGAGVEVYEYYDQSGCWWVYPGANLLLSHTPNLMSRPQFYVGKRFSFDSLSGQFDHIIGLMAAMARMNLLLVIATEDAVFAETNVYGDSMQGDAYHRGRDAVNYFSPGTRVEKVGQQIPYNAFQYLSNFERQLRQVSAYPVTDDNQSPNSFVTGRGLEELSNANDLHVREYQLSIADMLEGIDSIRLEWDETYYGERDKKLTTGESYTPTRHIKGDYRTKRVYGVMAGWDETSKILTGLQLMTAGVIDMETMRENIDGLRDITEIAAKVRNQDVERTLFEGLKAMAAQGDPRVMAALIGMLPQGDMRTLLEETMLAEPEAPAEDPMAAGPPVAIEGAPEPLQTMLGRLSAGSSGVTPTMSAQTVTAA